MSKYSVGLDVSAKEIHCCISFIDAMQNVTVKATRKVSNTAKGLEALYNEGKLIKLEPDETNKLIRFQRSTEYDPND